MKKTKIISVFILMAMLPAAAFCAQPAPKKTAAAAKKPAAASPKTAPEVKASPAADATPAKEQPAVGPAAAKPQADPFAAALEKAGSAEPVVRRQGVSYLAQSRDAKAIPDLFKALSDEVAGVRRAAVEGLGLFVWREAAPKLAQLLAEDKDASVRQQAAISLSYLSDPASGPALIKALKDQSPSVRSAALHTLGAIKYVPAEDSVIALLDSKDPNTCRAAISAAGMLQSAKAVPAVTALLGSTDQYIRMEAARALGDMGAVSAAPELKKLLAPELVPGIKVEAALSLAKMGFKDGLPAATELVNSPDLSVKGQALNVIALVGNADSLVLLETLSASEQDPGAKATLEFARQRLVDVLTSAKK
ncbi:MAG: hypothetical protein A2016_07430 [Elusimicrobia bacterium GWF2_62_30]|nr:MAG: hypothetical protein A2016_07430 [Elusimicrobia bacterium GWF2_62_30]